MNDDKSIYIYNRLFLYELTKKVKLNDKTKFVLDGGSIIINSIVVKYSSF